MKDKTFLNWFISNFEIPNGLSIKCSHTHTKFHIIKNYNVMYKNITKFPS